MRPARYDKVAMSGNTLNNHDDNNNNNNNNNYIICYYNNGGIQTTINYNTSTYDDNKDADADTDTAHSIHRTDNINKKWFDLVFNNNNIDIRQGPAQTCFFKHAAEVRDSPKFFKILRIEIENYPIIIRMGMY
jgi:hypothetical protein